MDGSDAKNESSVMNANELADSLMGWADDVYGGGETLIEAATMLRTIPALQAEIEALKDEVAQLKHMNKNWSISEGWALQEIELMKHFLKANQLYLSFEEWKHSDSARAILRKAQEK